MKTNLSKENRLPEIEACLVHSEAGRKASWVGVLVTKGKIIGVKDWRDWGLLRGLSSHHKVFSVQFHSK